MPVPDDTSCHTVMSRKCLSPNFSIKDIRKDKTIGIHFQITHLQVLNKYRPVVFRLLKSGLRNGTSQSANRFGGIRSI